MFTNRKLRPPCKHCVCVCQSPGSHHVWTAFPSSDAPRGGAAPTASRLNRVVLDCDWLPSSGRSCCSLVGGFVKQTIGCFKSQQQQSVLLTRNLCMAGPVLRETHLVVHWVLGALQLYVYSNMITVPGYQNKPFDSCISGLYIKLLPTKKQK